MRPDHTNPLTPTAAQDEANRIGRLPGAQQTAARENAHPDVIALLPRTSAEATTLTLAMEAYQRARAERVRALEEERRQRKLNPRPQPTGSSVIIEEQIDE